MNRRVFLGVGAAAVLRADVLPSARVSLGVIGAGWMGLATMKIFMSDPRVQVAGICDIDAEHLKEAAAAAPDARTFHEFEELLARPEIDAVYMAVPDHWHGIVAVTAARAGKDIYGEKPLAHNWAEGKAICDAVQRYGRVWQTGSWQRSLPDFRFACELVRNGRIGKVLKVEVGLPAGLTDWDGLGRMVDPTPPPKALDWQRWLGPAPWVPYAAARVHKTWRWNYDTGGGSLMDWVGHHVDIAHWGLGMDDSGPISVAASGEPSPHPIWNTPPRWRVTARYAGDLTMLIAGGYEDVRPGTKWIGDAGWVWVDRSGIEASPRALLSSKIGPNELRLPVTASHHRQFIDCVLSRGETLTPARVALRSATPGYLGNIAMQTGRTVRWDPIKQQILDDSAAERLLGADSAEPVVHMKRLILLCASVVYGADPETLVRQVAVYDYGKDPAAVRELEALVLRSGTSVEKLLISGLATAQTLAAKDAFCRNLAIAGGDAAVPQLAAMLIKQDTAEMARYALERIPGVKATAALRDALARVEPSLQTGIVVSLGRRKDAASVDAIRRLLAAKDPHLINAAAAALGNIATPAARDALLAAQPSPAVNDALLAIAERSSPVAAAVIYRRLGPAGLEGLARVDPTQATPLLRTALKSESARLQGIAIRELVRIEGVTIAKELPNVPERARVQILWALADSRKPDVRPVLVQAAASDSEAVRVAALSGLAKLGTAADIALLAGRAATAAGDEQTAARAALGAIRGDGVDAAILQALPGAEPKVKVELIRAVGERSISAPEVLLGAASDADRAVRTESVRALRETAGPQQARALLALLEKASNETDRRELERTVASAIRRSRDAQVSDVLTVYKNSADSSVRISLLNVLSAAGNSEALPVIRQALQDPSADIRRAALNALAAWPTPEPLDDLLALAGSPGDPARQILALRGYIKLVQIPSSRTPAETARLLKTAMAAATRADEKRAVLAVAQRLVCPESLELAKSAVNDPQVAAEAQLAVTTLERGLSFLKK